MVIKIRDITINESHQRRATVPAAGKWLYMVGISELQRNKRKKIRKAMRLRWFTRKLKLNEQPLNNGARKVTFGENLDKTIILKDWHFLTNGSQVKTGLGIKWKFLLYFIYLLWALHCRYLCVLLWTGCLRNTWW